jgi:fibronectin-binding autotransporter adhesin
MKPNRKNRFLVLGLSFTLAATSAFAADLYWDTDGAIAGSGAATGTWGTDLFWSADPTGANVGSPVLTATTSGVDDLFFSAGTNGTDGTVTVSGSQTARKLTFEEGAITLTGGTLTLAGGGGLTVLAGSGNPTISSNLTISGGNTFDVGSGRTLTLGATTRNSGSTLNVQGSGSVIFTSGSLSNRIVGPWASFGTSTSTSYATADAITGVVSALTYAASPTATQGTSAAASTDVISTASPGTVNYTLSAEGTLGANASINTLRWTGGAGTLTTSTTFTTKGILNAGTGLLTFSGPVRSASSGNTTEMVVNTANNDILFDGLLTGTITKTGSGTMTLGGAAAHSLGGITVNEGILVTDRSGTLGLPSATINSGGTLRFGSADDFNTSASLTVNAGGTLDLNAFNDRITNLSAGGSITTASSGSNIINSGALATLTLNGNLLSPSGATMSIGNNVTISKAGTFNIGTTAGADLGGNIIINSGGTVTVSTTTNSLVINGVGTNVTVNTGGTFSLPAGTGSIVVGQLGSANNTLNVAGGTVTTGAKNTTTSAAFLVGNSGTGTVTMTSGSVTTSATGAVVLFGSGGSSTGNVFNLNGGTLTTDGIVVSNGTAAFNFGGGTIKSNTGFTWDSHANMTATVNNGGLTVDTNGNTASIAQALIHGTGATTDSLTKIGDGTLTLSGTNTYSGATTVSAGTLFVTGSLASDVAVNANATLGGGGMVAAVSFAGGSFFDIALALAGNPLDSTTTISFSSAGFGIDNLRSNGAPVVWNDVLNGNYTLITGSLSSSNLDNFGSGDPFDIGGGRSAYFQSGSLQLVVIPEPGAALLGGLGLLALLRRRRN